VDISDRIPRTCLQSNPVHSNHYAGSAEKRTYRCNPTRERGVWPVPRSSHFTSWKDLVSCIHGDGWASGPIWMARKTFPPSGFNPWTVESVASTYTDYAIRAALVQRVSSQFSVVCTTTKQWFVQQFRPPEPLPSIMGFGALAGFYYTKRISCTHLKQKEKTISLQNVYTARKIITRHYAPPTSG
jgi:hypothetical protein